MIRTAEMNANGRVEARATFGTSSWLVSSKSWEARGEQLVFSGDARLIASDWVIRAPRVTITRTPDTETWLALVTPDGEAADKKADTNEENKRTETPPTLVFLWKKGIPIEAARARVELEGGKVSLEGLAKTKVNASATDTDKTEPKRDSVREE